MRLPSVIDAVEFRREEYGLNQSQWAKVLGLTRSHYSEFINEKRALPSKAMANAFCFGVPADCLFQCRPTKDIRHIRKLLKEPTK